MGLHIFLLDIFIILALVLFPFPEIDTPVSGKT